MFMWVSCGCWVVRNTTVLQETLFIHAFFGEGIAVESINEEGKLNAVT
ncbi:MAG: hypothetical protein HN922_01425 [Anaerolineae bacterium]|nr:hypothetical protein [Anaerolineae bacterium]